ncbi:hypothetical protein HYH02_012486 [Chlamydomonas schloesseri]|uniref:Uncharacterized protein n=1 Tax=Chlamydomonas schloesseri TaxID=2026947 RepID=A0A835T999_9CHLO|nr:hypothetical protein HYH02_012486 [Chlamydomonas schloesseri]|eukprot:KAG2433941.1 hypothetical protein HYH02_012486 [Chlamydomonas schloesseri]
METGMRDWEAAIAAEDAAVAAEADAQACARWGPAAGLEPKQGRQLQFPLTAYSVTLSLQKENVPMSWLDRVREWMMEHAEAGFAAYERGTRNDRGHIQAVMKLFWPPSDAYARRLKDLLRALLGVVSSPNRPVFAVKPFAREQRWGAMLGYCQKDRGKQHYYPVAHNVSDEELRQGFLEYKIVAQSFRGSRKLLTRKDFGESVHTFYLQHISPYRMPLEQVVYYMIASELWVPDSTWLTPGLGHGVKYERAAAWYKAVLWPREFSILHTFELFFDWGPGDLKVWMRQLGYSVQTSWEQGQAQTRGTTADNITGSDVTNADAVGRFRGSCMLPGRKASGARWLGVPST